eukprot:488625_1
MAEQKQSDVLFYWLLIAGTTDSKGVKYTDKKRDNGTYLNGVNKDMSNMEEWVNNESSSSSYWVVQNSIRMMRSLTKATALNSIKQCAQECKQKNGKYVRIYYTGHGENNTGNWCFYDGTISLKEVITTVISVYRGVDDIQIYCDCCFSGNWCIELSTLNVPTRVVVSAASWPGVVAWDTRNGGLWTLYKTEKKKESAMPKLKRCKADKRKGKNGSYSMCYFDQGKYIKKQ